ncbi:MAG: class I SAM-dependent methyltransferase [Bacteroidales bacterium]|nr:class I SAM-dependent methyltransferase [Bacteroidales bacterium]
MTIEQPSELWKDYELIDSGNFEKLERFGRYVLIRPEPKALWDRSLSEKEWLRMAHMRFKQGAGFSKAGKEDSGTWEMLRKMDEQWVIRYFGSQSKVSSEVASDGGSLGSQGGSQNGLRFSLRLGLTAFKHVGVFPEQAPNWEYIYQQTLQLTKPKVLNLFAYTGAASLAAKAAGADVTHLDSVRQVVTWARNNMEISGMDNIRWIVEDALKFVRREERRGNVYQGIILDPPAYGHGPDGEKWKLDESLFEMLKCVNAILAPQNSFLVLNLYSNGYSAVLGETLVRQAFGTDFKSLDCGELVLRDSFSKSLPLSIFVRLRR